MEKYLYLNVWLYNHRKRPWRTFKNQRTKRPWFLRKLLAPALCALLAAEALALWGDWDRAAGFLGWLAHTESYTRMENGGAGSGQRESGFSIDFKEGNIKIWKSEQIPSVGRD